MDPQELKTPLKTSLWSEVGWPVVKGIAFIYLVASGLVFWWGAKKSREELKEARDALFSEVVGHETDLDSLYVGDRLAVALAIDEERKKMAADMDAMRARLAASESRSCELELAGIKAAGDCEHAASATEPATERVSVRYVGVPVDPFGRPVVLQPGFHSFGRFRSRSPFGF